jgi:hypothetical protein
LRGCPASIAKWSRDLTVLQDGANVRPSF